DTLGVLFLFASVGVRFPFALYVGYLSGRGQIQGANLIFLITELLRILGALVLVAWLGPQLTIFFGWQLLIAVVATVTVYFVSWSMTPSGGTRIVRDWRGLFEVRSVIFSASTVTIMLIVTNSL